MDDSADAKRDVVFSVAGFIGDTEKWFDAERYWRIRLEQAEIDYFRTYECLSLEGEFQRKLVDRYGLTTARVIADALLRDLKQIVATSDIYAYCCGVLMDDYRSVCREPDGAIVLNEDPYVFAHQTLIGLVLDEVHGFPRREVVGFLYDEHSKAALLQGSWADFKECNPNWARAAGTLEPLDDKANSAIQMADLLANLTTKVFVELRTEPDAAKRILHGWLKGHLVRVSYVDGTFLKQLVAANLPRFKSKGAKRGLLVRSLTGDDPDAR